MITSGQSTCFSFPLKIVKVVLNTLYFFPNLDTSFSNSFTNTSITNSIGIVSLIFFSKASSLPRPFWWSNWYTSLVNYSTSPSPSSWRISLDWAPSPTAGSRSSNSGDSYKEDLKIRILKMTLQYFKKFSIFLLVRLVVRWVLKISLVHSLLNSWASYEEDFRIKIWKTTST